MFVQYMMYSEWWGKLVEENGRGSLVAGEASRKVEKG